MNVLIIGSGAVGSFYGALLAKSGAHVTVLARSDYEHISQHGIDIHSESDLGDWHFTPFAVIRHASELPTPPDYVLLCIKIVKDSNRVDLIRDAVGPHTSIVLLSNGVEIEHDIAEAFPNSEIISGLAFVCVTRTAPGKIWHQAYGRLAFGKYPEGSSDSITALCSAFTQAGISCDESAHIGRSRWQKCLWNAPFNPLSVLSGGLGTNDILSTQEALVRTLMEEIKQIAEALGYTLPADIIDKQISSTYKMPPYKTSMLLDYEAGRPMETEAILGNAVREGHRAGVAIPHLDTLYALMKLRELEISLQTDKAVELDSFRNLDSEQR